MGLIHIMERSSDSQVRRFEDGLKMAKEGIMEACEVFDEMKAQFSDRGYSSRGGYGNRGGYGQREDWDGMDERRIRDLEGQIEELKTERQTMQKDFEKRIQDLTKLIQATSNYPARGADGKFVKLSTEE